MSLSDDEAAARAQVVAQRAIRRLDVLEWVIFAVGAVLATLGGGVIARIISPVVAWDFRSVWIGASLLLFIVSGTIAVVHIRKEERADALRRAVKQERGDG